MLTVNCWLLCYVARVGRRSGPDAREMTRLLPQAQMTRDKDIQIMYWRHLKQATEDICLAMDHSRGLWRYELNGTGVCKHQQRRLLNARWLVLPKSEKEFTDATELTTQSLAGALSKWISHLTNLESITQNPIMTLTWNAVSDIQSVYFTLEKYE